MREAVRLGVCVWCGSALVRDDDAPHRWRCQRSIAGKCVARGYWHILDDDLDYVPFSAALGAVAEVREAAEGALGVLTDLAESAAYWSEYDVPLGIVSRVDFAKARLAAALAAKGGA